MTSAPAASDPRNFGVRLAFALAVVLSALAALLALAVTSTAEAAKGTKGPKGDAFYQPPSKLPKGHGKLIWARDGSDLIDPADDARSRRVLYTSKSPQRERIAVSGSVAVPNGEPPKDGWPIITWAHGTTGLADSCAPSREGYGLESFIDEWIKAGYAVARTDYEGLGTPGPHPYLVGKSAARSTLDIVRAARRLDPDIGDEFVIAGVSQGGHAALWTAGYADSWVPDLNLRGTMAYAPASHIADQISLLPALTSPNPLSALAVSILAGAATANPGIVPAELLKPEPLALLPEVEQKCLGELSQTDSLGGIPPSELIQDGADLTELVKVLTKNNPAVESSAPILVLQGTADTTVFPTYTDQLVQELENKGDDVSYAVVPGATHGSIVAEGKSDSDAFLDAHLPAG